MPGMGFPYADISYLVGFPRGSLVISCRSRKASAQSEGMRSAPNVGRAVAALIPATIFATLPQAGHFPHLQSAAKLAARALKTIGHFIISPAHARLARPAPSKTLREPRNTPKLTDGKAGRSTEENNQASHAR